MPPRKTPTADDQYPVDARTLLAEEDRVFKAYQERAEEDFLCFVRGLTIASSTGPRVFETVMAPFQRKCFEDLAPSIESLRNGDMPEWPRWWLERTKKASKDADLAVILLWLLCFPRRPFYAQVGAGDRGQAAIVKERIAVLLHLNPWLNDYVESVKYEVRSRKLMISGEPLAHLDIMAADVSGAHGGTPDLLVINELTHITKWEFAQNLMDNANGVPQGMALVATNAGYKGTPQETWRQNAMTGRRWRVHVWDRPAPWHNEESIEDAKKQEASKSRFNRLWWGKWPSGKGDALDEEALDRCFQGQYVALTRPLDGWLYVGGMDLGIHHDHSGVVVLGVHVRRRTVALAYMRAWELAGANKEVLLTEVQREVLRLADTFCLQAMFYDPWQATLMAQQCRGRVLMVPMTFTPANLSRMATSLIQVVESKQLRLFDIDGGRLRKDLGKLNIVEKPYGYRLEAVRDESGHADVGTALVIALPGAIELMNGTSRLMPDDVLVDTGEEQLTEDEVNELPPELREIYDMDQEDELSSFYNRRNSPVADVL